MKEGKSGRLNFENMDYDTKKPEEVEELTEKEDKSLFTKVGKAVVALVLALTLIYFSGLREYFFFDRTSPDLEVAEIESAFELEVVEIPINVLIIREPVSGSQRDSEEVEILIQNTSNLLNQADLELKKTNFYEEELEREEVSEILSGNFLFLEKLSNREINLILVRTLRGLNGVAYPSRNTIIIPDYTAGRDYRTFAHEVGHILGLGHVDDPRYVMSQGERGVLFSEEEIIKMRQIADEKF